MTKFCPLCLYAVVTAHTCFKKHYFETLKQVKRNTFVSGLCNYSFNLEFSLFFPLNLLQISCFAR